MTASSEQRLPTTISQTNRQSDEPGFSSASRSPDVEQRRAREISFSREHDDAVVTQASADKTSDSGLTFQLSEDPLAYDPAAYASSFRSMSDLIPRMVEKEKQVVSSSEAVASSKSSKESLRLTV